MAASRQKQQQHAYARHSEEAIHSLLPGIATKRLDLFLHGPFDEFNLTSALDRARRSDDQTVDMTVWSCPGTDKATFQQAKQQFQSGAGRPLKKGDFLGKSWSQHWVHANLTIPKEFQDSKEPVIFEFDPGCEGMIFDLEGNPIHGITGGPNSTIQAYPGYVEDRRVEHIIPRDAVKAGRYECWIEVACNGIFGIGINGLRHHPPDMNMDYTIDIADLILQRSEAAALRTDFQILHQLVRHPNGAQSSLSRRALKAANDIMNAFRSDTPELIDTTVKEGRAIAAEVIGDSSKALEEDEDKLQIWAIGHCHIDTGWLWRYLHTQQKVARSWSTQIDLMARYPEHQFTASSAQQFVWLEQLYPALFDKVIAATKAGKFHPIGGSWLEHDCVLPSGESLIRQYLYGQRYFQEKFGVRSRVAWLPDTFGYAPQLPQILRLAGIDYFFTQKLSWNNINVFPNSTFNCKSISSVVIVDHVSGELLQGIEKNKNLEVTDECLLLFGNGDGGGGPTALMLEKLRRLGSLAHRDREVPSVQVASPERFFEHLCRKSKGGKKLPTWRGELYFELHRGTFTSQAAIKSGNKSMEKLLRDVEYFAILASISNPSYTYPKPQLDEIWHDIMLNQFHDVLPGTSIKMCNDDAREIYRLRLGQTRELLDQALNALFSKGQANGHSQSELVTLDSLRLPRAEVIKLPADLAGQLGEKPTQPTEDGCALAFMNADETGLGAFPASTDALDCPSAVQSGGSFVLSNSQLQLIIANGRITSLVDLTLDRELILSGPGTDTAGLMLYEDYPLSYDAWDAEIYHLDCGREVPFDEVEVLADGPLRSTIKTTSRFGQSVVVLEISINARAPGQRSYIDVAAKVDWHEKHKILKFALPVDIHSSQATYGTQFGVIERPTHRNTQIDQAKFEVCAHMFADLSEAGYGMTIVSDYKYGYAVEGNAMRISLLRSATAPDPEQDQGEHEFTFALMPHAGRLLESGVVKDALRYVNNVHDKAVLPATFDVDSKSVILETIKRGENDFTSGSSSKSLILRLYDSLGGRTKCPLKITGLKPTKMAWVNALEEETEGAAEYITEGDITTVYMDFGCFEVKTLSVWI
ncbi:hypothetical protein IAT38_007333 [Cryptococcus sp. DSM 104549]